MWTIFSNLLLLYLLFYFTTMLRHKNVLLFTLYFCWNILIYVFIVFFSTKRIKKENSREILQFAILVQSCGTNPNSIKELPPPVRVPRMKALGGWHNWVCWSSWEKECCVRNDPRHLHPSWNGRKCLYKAWNISLSEMSALCGSGHSWAPLNPLVLWVHHGCKLHDCHS